MRVRSFLFLTITVIAGLVLAFHPQEEKTRAFSLFLTGGDHGILEPCGCSGGQLGGIARRQTLLEALSSGSESFLTLSTGGLAGGTDALYRIRFQITMLCLDEMGYQGVGIGPEELALGLDELRNVAETVEFPFINTNVHFPEESDLPFIPFLIQEVGGFQVRILSLIPESLSSRLPENARFQDPGEAMEEALAMAPDADMTVVLLRGSREEAKALDAHLSGARLIIYSYDHSEPRVYDFGKREGIIRYLSPGDRGRFLVSCHVKWSDQGELEPIEATEEALELDLFESETILIYMGWYRDMVIDEGVLGDMVEIHPAPPGAPYVGEETCVLCHEAAHKTWIDSKHAHALATLKEAKRDFDPDCLSCHVIGFGNKTGFRSLEETPHLVNVSCETCHGPCSEHVESAGKAPTPLKVDCMTCHNLEHSTSFDQEEYWKQITCTSDPPYKVGMKDGKTGEKEQPGEGDRQETENDRKGH